MNLKRTELHFLMVFLVKCLTAELSPDGDNVCLKSETYQDKIEVPRFQPKHNIKAWCWQTIGRFKCNADTMSREKIVRVVNRTRIVPVCCDGYKEEEGEVSKCAPVCLEGCVHGKCIAPETCSCDSGFHGLKCDEFCPQGRWGENCKNECECVNEGECDRVTGCACKPGWKGDRCELPCPEGYYGHSCENKCDCGGESCDPGTGICFTQRHASERSLLETTIEENPVATQTSTEKIFRTTDTNPFPMTTTTMRESMITTGNTFQTNPKEESIVIMSTTDFTTRITTKEDTSTMNAFTTRIITEEDALTTAPEATPTMTDTATTAAKESIWVTDTPTAVTSGAEEMTTVQFINGSSSLESSSTKEPSGQTDFSTITVTYTKTEKTPEEVTMDFEINIKHVVDNAIPFTEHPESVTTVRGFTARTEIKIQPPKTPELGVVTNKPLMNNIWESSVDSNENIFSAKDSQPSTTDIQLSHFIPSLAALSGISVLLFIMGGRWLILRYKRKETAVPVERSEMFFHLENQRKSSDGLFWVNNCKENPVYLSEVDLATPTPVLQTFKPVTTEPAVKGSDGRSLR